MSVIQYLPAYCWRKPVYNFQCWAGLGPAPIWQEQRFFKSGSETRNRPNCSCPWLAEGSGSERRPTCVTQGGLEDEKFRADHLHAREFVSRWVREKIADDVQSRALESHLGQGRQRATMYRSSPWAAGQDDEFLAADRAGQLFEPWWTN